MKAILTYHSIDASGSRISLSPGAFRGHIQHLLASNVRIVSIEALLADRMAPGDAAALTFDDGYASVAREAAPVLEEHGLPATVFVVTGRVGTTNEWDLDGRSGVPQLPLLDWPALGRLAERGLTIASHTRTHPRLPALSPMQVDDEVGGASRDLTERLGRAPRGFAYPYGLVSAPVRSAAGRWHPWAVSAAFRELAADDPLELPRIDMWYFATPGLFERWGTASFRRWIRRRHRLRQMRSAVFRLAGR